MLRPELLEALESKLIRHGYSYVGNDILPQVTEWVENHELFKGFDIVLDDESRYQVCMTLKGFYESRF